MTTVTTTTTATTAAPAYTGRRSHPLVRATVASGAVAAVTTTAVAATAHAAGVPFAIDGEQIPLLGFAQMAFLGAVIGGVIVAALNRWSSHARRTFLVVAAVLTALSCVPSVALPPDTATKLPLVATHLIAAAIVVPVLARRTVR